MPNQHSNLDELPEEHILFTRSNRRPNFEHQKLFGQLNSYAFWRRRIAGAPWVLLDWGDTVMVNFPQYHGTMTDWPKVAACPGIEDALASLARNYNLGLATNAQDSETDDIRKALSRVGLGDAFDAIFCFRELGHLKPTPAFYQQIIKKLACPPSEIIMVGDDFMGDIIGATVAGMQAVWYNPGGTDIRSGAGYTTIFHLKLLNETLAGLQLPGANFQPVNE